MIISVIPKFNLEEALFEAKQRCFWFIDEYDKHRLSAINFSAISTDLLCEMYGISPNYFKLNA